MATARKQSDVVGFYVACGHGPSDTIFVFSDPARDMPRLHNAHPEIAKSVMPGVDIEEANEKITGVRVYPTRKRKGETMRYHRLRTKDVQQLRKLIDVLAPAVRYLKRALTQIVPEP